MPLTRFADIALDWSRVYAVICEPEFDKKDSYTDAEIVTLWFDVSHIPVGSRGGSYSGLVGKRIWALAKRDSKLSVFGKLAVDMSKIVSVTADDSQGGIVFCLASGGSGTIPIENGLAKAILESLPESK